MSRRKRRMDAQTAIDVADSADLPDGAYFAMVGDLMGGDYMDGVEAVLAADGAPMMSKPDIDLPKGQVRGLAPYGTLRRCDIWHYQIRDGKTVVADFWPHSKVPKWRVGKDGPASKGTPLDLIAALSGGRRSGEILQRATASELLQALLDCAEHMEHSTPKGRAAYEAARAIILRMKGLT